MYKLTLYFDNNAIVFEIYDLEGLNNLLKEYPNYIKMTLERVKTLKR
jgi:hypothetical protein